MAQPRRRDALLALALALGTGSTRAGAAVLQGALPWMPDKMQPPQPVSPGGWQFFTADEAATVEALVDRLTPSDPETPGGKDTGCAVFIDRQLAGPYGRTARLYTGGPCHEGTTQQGFFADPIYGGNRDMVAWKMIGFPGALRLPRLGRSP